MNGGPRSLARTNQFKKDYKRACPTALFRRAVKRGYDVAKLFDVVERLAKGDKLEQRFRDHSLTGEYSDCRECHIQSDWALIYQLTQALILIRTGTHSDLFE